MLDNPLWSSLTTEHRGLAIIAGPGSAGARSTPEGSAESIDGDARRFPAEVAPFLTVAAPGASAAGLVAPGETVYTIGPRPTGAVERLGEILQMVCSTVPEVPDGPPITPPRRADVLALAALVYPHYFRPRTIELGRYLGIYDGDRLAAMVGERMGMPGYRELSAVCTHPDFVGKGLARRLLVHLCTDLAARGVTPFLHVSPTNTRAIRLYEQNGFAVRRALAFGALHG